ncbi:NAD(P)-binding Rossmann-fold superfamily protein [Citrus sinensis]|nr:NAD(P)-binding Rossmann-fold superfamily protein [Citrus sinensis]
MKETLRYLAGIAGPSGYGSKSTAEQVTQGSVASHLTAIITGATSGIGAETARVLAKRGVRVVIPARDLKRAAEVKEGIQRESPNAEVLLFEIDLSSLVSVQRFCHQFLALGLPLNILMPLSIDRNGIRKDDRNSCRDSYNGTCAYAQSKLATIMHAKEMSRQLKGASTTCYAALSPQIEGVSGKYFADCNESNCSALANDESEAKKLWKQTRALIHRRLRQPSVKHL